MVFSLLVQHCQQEAASTKLVSSKSLLLSLSKLRPLLMSLVLVFVVYTPGVEGEGVDKRPLVPDLLRPLPASSQVTCSLGLRTQTRERQS